MKQTLHTLLFLCAILCIACESEVNFSLNPNSLQMKVGEITTINIIGDATNIEWASSDDSVATVFHGTVTANAIGNATITAKSGSTIVNAQVFVSGTDGSTLRISPAFVSLKKGDTYQFQYGNTYGLDLTWTSSAEDIVQVDQQGTITALKSGNATITLSTPVESVSALVAVEHQWGDYSLVWSDEFNGSKLDESVWNYNTGGGGWGNNELQYYTNRPENIRLVNGCLEIEARKEKYENREYTSARIYSKGKKSFLYGKMEARIKFPGGVGTWPAFWMMGESGGWPKCGEIDIMEHVGYLDNRASFALHTQEKNGSNGRNWHATHFFDYPLSNDFHVYGVEWCQEEENGKDCIHFLVDGEIYATVWETKIGDHDSWPFYKPHYFILNLAIGGNMGGKVDDSIFNQQRIMYVDWVRVYQRQEQP
ncbi:MAG: family 16 glycosylhydrolase [Paludibacteraceae bacterium]|nr:family 16 glycosylhydrolase [Paludibacteraceae bacterium]MBP3576238.1 family 16 glycosylhydrolase [Paludibacteraceae bacterium]